MSYPTQPAFIQYSSGWEQRWRTHPVYDFMCEHHLAFDEGNMKTQPYTDWHTSELTLTKPNGETVSPGQPSWDALLEQYAPFSAHRHQPVWVAIWETDDGGYEFVGNAKMFADLLVPGGVKSKQDSNGRKWDVEGQAMSMCRFVRDPSGPKGLKLAYFKLFLDPTPLMGEMVKRGMVNGSDLMKMLGI